MKPVIITQPDLIKVLQYLETKLGAPAGNLIASVQAEFSPDASFKKCNKCGTFLLVNSENFDGEERLCDGFSHTCIRCRRKKINSYWRNRRLETRLRKQNPGYDEDQAEIARVRADYEAEKAAVPTAPPLVDEAPPKVGRPHKPLISWEEGQAIQRAAGRI